MATNVVTLKRQTERTLESAVEAFLDRKAQLAATTRRVYGVCLGRLVADIGGDTSIEEITLEDLEHHLEDTYPIEKVKPATYNRNVATITSLFTWITERGWVATSPATSLERRRERRTRQQEAQRRVIASDQLAEWTSDPSVGLRERLLWQMLYDSAARASEILNLDIEDLDVFNRSAVVIGKGGDAQRVYWTSATARLLPRYMAGRTTGPLFLASRRRPPAKAAAAGDTDPVSGLPRLSYRRAAQLFKSYTGRTLHALRRSKLTHLAEAGENVALIRGISRHASLRSLEPYVSPSDEAIQAAVQRHDSNNRR